jgi:hypothetical protein
MQPKRVRLSRRKGWRKPENTVVVARPSTWGNPFVIGEGGMDRAHAVAAFRTMMFEESDATRVAMGYPSPEAVVAALAGKNLACWCPLDEPCHADVLLEVANTGRQSRPKS